MSGTFFKCHSLHLFLIGRILCLIRGSACHVLPRQRTLGFSPLTRRENSKMPNSNPNHGAKLAADRALRPASGQANISTTTTTTVATTFHTTIPTTTQALCVKCSRARRKPRQINQIRPADIPGSGGPVRKSWVSVLGRSWVARLYRPQKGGRDARALPRKVYRYRAVGGVSLGGRGSCRATVPWLGGSFALPRTAWIGKLIHHHQAFVLIDRRCQP